MLKAENDTMKYELLAMKESYESVLHHQDQTDESTSRKAEILILKKDIENLNKTHRFVYWGI